MKKLLLFMTIALCFSCKRDILDITPKDRVGEDAVWGDENLIRAYHNELYNAIPHGFYTNMYSKYSDEAVMVATCCGDFLILNTTTPDNIGSIANDNFWGGYMYYWDRGYTYIRKINVFLDKMATTTVSIADKKKLIAEARFIRAFIYFEQIKRFGGVPIVTQVYALGQQATFKRNTYDECVAFIEKELNESMPDLPVKLASTDANFGRATQDASKALLSRVDLYAASPLNNPTHDNAKWQKAADAALAVINSGNYKLYPDYKKEFVLTSGQDNSEMIFSRNFTTTNGQQAPPNNLGRRYGGYGGWSAANGPSQNIVDDYDMINGQPAFTTVGGVKTVNAASGYDVKHPYANRDPRFDATIIHDESTFHGDFFEMWVASDGKTWGFDSYKQNADNPTSSYEWRKFMPEDQPITFQLQYTQPWPHFRLAEMYLNYAEAKFELGDEGTCRQYLSLVRARVGMPAIPGSVTGADLRARLYNERRIELALEGHRFWDVRRWKIGSQTEVKPLQGMQVIKDVATGVKTYTPVTIRARGPWDEKYNYLPIDASEIRRNPGLTQTPGY